MAERFHPSDLHAQSPWAAPWRGSTARAVFCVAELYALSPWTPAATLAAAGRVRAFDPDFLHPAAPAPEAAPGPKVRVRRRRKFAPPRLPRARPPRPLPPASKRDRVLAETLAGLEVMARAGFAMGARG